PRQPPPTSTPFPYTTLFRSASAIPLESAPGDSCPGVRRLEDILEVEDPVEALDVVVVLLHQNSEFHERENDLAEIPGTCDSPVLDRKSTRLNSSHVKISYAV